MGQARPHHIGRHVHPAVKPDATAPVEATGIDYLRLLEAAHQREVGQAINYPALADENPPNPAGPRTGSRGEPGRARHAGLAAARARDRGAPGRHRGDRPADQPPVLAGAGRLHRRFVHPVTTAEGHHIGAWIDWPAALTALQHGELPSSASEADMLRIAASLAHGTTGQPCAQVLGGLDAHNITAVTTAITTANGS